jgi:hypothetical protein
MIIIRPPARVAIPMARTIAQGTAVEAFEACRYKSKSVLTVEAKVPGAG